MNMEQAAPFGQGIFQAPGGEESFWPSFTDVMMVVVIVFLLSSTAVVLHNWDLANQVRAMIMLEQQARTEAEDLTAQQKLLHAELEHLRERMAHASAALTHKSQTLAARDAELKEAQSGLFDLRASTLLVQKERDRLLEEMELAKAANAKREQQLLAAQQQLVRLEEEKAGFEKMFVTVDAQHRQTLEELEMLRTQHAEIEEKYRVLMKPARSALGKVSVAVRYTRRDGQLTTELRIPDSDKFLSVDSETLHQMLGDLKEQHSGQLFLRIIIPTGANLSYEEGWQFSLDLLRRYDYYYQ